ncbi:biotin--[acetyl-CoA-carboxylase] ligase [Thermoanaerobacterium sp. DL9XJH110]|uniref:biotin--[acetyl-CoA-carboxylase] ligase n=1 Tax=Thermoanaerobacterium sp. DL9XJH110 TaxID=3386643 RepID=UPI003BB4C464
MGNREKLSLVADMSNPDKLLMLLLSKKGEYISGEEISERFGVTRTAIWKHINLLRQMGYKIESSTRLGYRLVRSPDLLLPEEVWARVKLSFLGRRIYYFTTVGSTNDEARKLALEGAVHGTLLLAEEQVGGKGRMGRAWVSPRGAGIWLSMILRPDLVPYEAPKLTMLTAVAVAETIKGGTGLDAAIKWPNDVMINGKKVCGILTEISAEMDAVNYVVIGIGINVNNDDFPGELKDRATSLKLEKKEAASRIEVLTGFLESFENYYFTAMNQGFKNIFEKWRSLCCNLARPVKIIRKNDSFDGIALDIDDEGALMVKRNDGEIVRVLSGDVSLR